MALDNDILVATSTVPVAGEQEHHSYVDWPAVIGGIVLATAISVLLLAFGSAIGLSFANFDASPDVNPLWIAIAAASWLLWVQISSFMAGGYITGRMRRRHYDATEHESDVRDGAHGLLVWAGALVIGAIIAVGGVGAALNAAGSAVATLTTAASNVADEGALDPQAYFVDTLFRAGPGSTAAAGTLQDYRGEATRILANGAVSGTVPDADKAYLAQLVAANTGLTPDEATARVNEVLTAVDTAKAQAADVAEEARKWTVLGAFLTAASLLVSAVGAYWAAMKGGNHRDKQTVFADVFKRF
ncbi:MAG: hypothetical protein EOP22_14770 [Hyphomicrobiales bacterium]|nr:MAG: hypothetical protein EOP22_14770 [Hyphomicrobiales bacterium]